MKKTRILLRASLFVAAMLFAGCSDDDKKPGPENPPVDPPVTAVNYTIDFTSLTEAAYLGDKYQTGAGVFLLVLTDAEGDALEVELVSQKAPKPSVAMPLTGQYTAAENHLSGTFVAQTAYWTTSKKGVEAYAAMSAEAPSRKRFAIASGTIVLAATPEGKYSLTGTVADADIARLEFTWSGTLLFENRSGETDPVEYEIFDLVYGDYYASEYGIAENTYMLKGGNERFELSSQFCSSTPKDPSAPLPSDGEYTIDLRSDEGQYANEPFTFRSGYLNESSRPRGTYWKDAEGTAYLATSGTFTVSTEGDKWKIEGILRDDAADKELAFVYTGNPTFRN